jgi:hypothetical protein
MSSFFYQVIVFFNRVLHMISSMFIAGMCTISYLSDNNLFSNRNLRDEAYFFGTLILITGLFNVYHLHKWFRYAKSDRKARNFVLMIVFKLCLVVTLTEYFDLFLTKASINYN